ncbi:MAG: polyprenyl synthetase family protein [Planctomycetota bacterium]|nr:polyprenyl synthetase family protein [Planctomycetota bacterium]
MNSYAQRLLDQSLFGPVNDFTGCQGKRIRSSLLQLSYELSGGVGPLSPAISEAIESLHAGSLVIDDIQDDSQSRRGQQTMHHRIGVPLAINAGNWMYFHALECLSAAPLPMEQRDRLLASMIRAARQCHEGQAIDLHSRVDRVPAMHWHEATLAISTLKTGELVSLAVDMGSIAANPNSPLSGALRKFGRQIGIALQMRNDLDELAKIAQAEATSQAIHSIRDEDLRNARLTWPWVWAFELQEMNGRNDRCASMLQRIVFSERDRHNVAVELFAIVGTHGDQVIRSLVRDQLRLLGEHVLDERMLHALGEILEPIERPIAAAKLPDKMLVNSFLGNVSHG